MIANIRERKRKKEREREKRNSKKPSTEVDSVTPSKLINVQPSTRPKQSLDLTINAIVILMAGTESKTPLTNPRLVVPRESCFLAVF